MRRRTVVKEEPKTIETDPWLRTLATHTRISQKRYLDEEEFCIYAGIKHSYLKKLIQKGQVPVVHLWPHSRKNFIDMESLKIEVTRDGQQEY